MSRRTEMAYKAQSPGKLAPHNEALDSGDRVNAAVVQRKFTFLSGEICLTRDEICLVRAPGLDHRGNKGPGISGRYRRMWEEAGSFPWSIVTRNSPSISVDG